MDASTSNPANDMTSDNEPHTASSGSALQREHSSVIIIEGAPAGYTATVYSAR
jgi:alkyl hydroperoxide reductase subunit AhpF